MRAYSFRSVLLRVERNICREAMFDRASNAVIR